MVNFQYFSVLSAKLRRKGYPATKSVLSMKVSFSVKTALFFATFGSWTINHKSYDRMLKNLNLKVKVLLFLLLIFIITSGVIGMIAFTLVIDTLKEESYKKLIAIREMKATQIERYFDMLFDQVKLISESGTLQEAIMDLKERSETESLRKYHPIFKNYLDLLGLDDMFIIDAGSGEILYALNQIDLVGSDLRQEFLSNTCLSKVFQSVTLNDDPDFICFEDFSYYPPSGNAPVSFIASPIYHREVKFGVLIFQLPLEKLNAIMTDGYEWESVGLGKSGETYLVGSDFLMRSQSRFLIEDPAKFFIELEKTDIPKHTISRIKEFKSTIGLQPVLTQGAKAAIEGESGTQTFPDYRGIEVLSAYKPMEIHGVNWVIMSEIDKSEAYAAIPWLLTRFILWFIILLVPIVVLSILFSRSISRPVRILAQIASNLAEGNLEDPVKIERTDEIGVLADNFEMMRTALKKLVGDLREVNQTLELNVNQRTIELERAKKAAEAILDESPVPVAVVDPDTASYLRVNFAMTEFHKLSSSELLKRNTTETYAYPERDRPIIFEQLKKHGRIENLDVYSKRIGTGEERRTLINVHPISYFGQKVFITSLIDITERIRMEEELKTLSTAMESAENAIIITNPQGFIQWINPSFTNLTGYTLDEIKGRKTDMLKSGKHDEILYSDIWRTIQSGEVWRGEIINKKKNGELYFEDMTITPVTDSDDNIVQFVAIKQDITERKRLENIVIQAKERMEEELNVARDIQMSMLPLVFPPFPGRNDMDLYAKLIPAREVGGDFYDFYFLDDTHLCFVVGDVSGKGVPAALLMAVTKTLLKSQAGNDRSTASILSHVNNEIAKDNDANMFITVFIAILNTSTGELVFSNAGHNPSFIITPGNGIVKKLSGLNGPVVGAMEDMTFTESTCKLGQEDIVLAYTDGVTESHNNDEEMYSESRLEKLLEQKEYSSVQTLTEKIFESVKTFEDGAEQFDDITVLAVQYCQKSHGLPGDNLSIKIQNTIEAISIVLEQFETFGKKNEIPDSIIKKFSVVCDEVLNNIISYGFDDKKDHVVQVDIILEGEQLIFTFTDDGSPFNPFNQDPPNTELSMEEREIGGLGIHLVRNMVDEYNYKRIAGRNTVVLVKNNINEQL